MFRSSATIFSDVGKKIAELVGEEDDDAKDACYADSQEAEAGFSEVEAIYRWINERKAFEKRVVNPICKRSLEIVIISISHVILSYR